MSCKQTRSLMSSYMDGAVTGVEMQQVAQHLSGCETCAYEYALQRQTLALVGRLGRRQAPPELATTIRLAISREAARARNWKWTSLLVRLENSLNSFMVPATAGMVSAVVFFGLLMGFFALPSTLEASDDDVPAMIYTPPELASSPFELNANGGSLLVEAVVDPNGRVQDYRVISGESKDRDQVMQELKNTLIFTVFRPATAFGKPTSGRVVLSFSKVNVRG
ncbi:MAG TPA: zf-HC2 domain-containing protein [Terriglobales bacterium]|nr:zf-HC2 domain-containing protein [Terriglobales bacterium]